MTKQISTTGRPPGRKLDGLRSDAAFLDGKGSSKYNGFWDGINGNPVRINTAPARGRKRHADDGTLRRKYADIKKIQIVCSGMAHIRGFY